MPSSLARVAPRALGSSPRLPVSVSGTGTHDLARGFFQQYGISHFGTPISLPFTPQVNTPPDFPGRAPLRAWPHSTNSAVGLPPCVTPSLITVKRWCRNINRLPITYAFRPQLRPRLTLSGRAFLRNPRASGGPDSHQPFRYSYRHSHFHPLQPSSRSAFPAGRTLPYH